MKKDTTLLVSFFFISAGPGMSQYFLVQLEPRQAVGLVAQTGGAHILVAAVPVEPFRGLVAPLRVRRGGVDAFLPAGKVHPLRSWSQSVSYSRPISSRWESAAFSTVIFMGCLPVSNRSFRPAGPV